MCLNAHVIACCYILGAIQLALIYSSQKRNCNETSIKQTPSLKRTLTLVLKLMSHISLYNKPLLSAHLY